MYSLKKLPKEKEIITGPVAVYFNQSKYLNHILRQILVSVVIKNESCKEMGKMPVVMSCRSHLCL
jgi:hypothetical protein